MRRYTKWAKRGAFSSFQPLRLGAAVKRGQVAVVALISMVGLSGQSLQSSNNRCEDFTTTPIAQIRACNDFLGTGIDTWHALMMRAAAYLRARDLDNARKDSAQALYWLLNKTGFSDEADWYASVCLTYAMLNDVGEAVPYCNEAMKRRSGSGFPLVSRGFVNLRTANFAQALEDFDKALDMPLTVRAFGPNLLDQRRHYALFGRGIARLRLGDTDRGNADITAAEKLKPGVTIELKLYGLSP